MPLRSQTVGISPEACEQERADEAGVGLLGEIQSYGPTSATNCSTGHAGREERPTLSTRQVLILRLLLAVGPFFFFLFPIGLCTIPLLRCPSGDIVDLGRR